MGSNKIKKASSNYIVAASREELYFQKATIDAHNFRSCWSTN
jgi:hypothetical protein